MKKQTKVLLAAALFTLGASFSSMAALKNGTWVMNDEGWQYADKDGEYVEEEWCMSNGIEFWINEDEVLGSSEWVVEDGYTYYVQSDGSKTKSAWKYLYAINDEDQEGDQYWYYFDAKGRMLDGVKKAIGDYTYYFDADGKMLTGWVDAKTFTKASLTEDIADVVYTNEDGQLVKSSWLEVFPWTKNADDCYEGEDEKVFYATKDGSLAKTKTKIDDLTYFFNSETGVMFTGWVIKGMDDVYTGANTKHNKDFSSETVKEAYWTDDLGYAKTNAWREATCPADEKTYWYHFDKLGRAFLATSTNAVTAEKVTLDNGEEIADLEYATGVQVNSKKINGKEYFFQKDGRMIDGFQRIGNKLYFLEGGEKQTGKITVTDANENDYTFYFAEKTDAEDGITKYEAVTGAYKNYIYVNGQLITSEDSDSYRLVENVKDGKDYVVDYKGKIQHKDGETYNLSSTKLYFHDTEDYILN